MNNVLSASTPIHKRRASIPTFLAYLAGCTFTLASAATNLTYAIARADTLAPQIIWGSVAVAASVALALAPSAIVASLASRRFGAASLALVAALIFGAYSVTAALGSATGGRLVAETEASDTASRRAAALSSIGKADVELALIGSGVRTVPVVDAEISQVYSRTPGLDDCVPKPNWTPSKQHREACKSIAALNVERASAQRKADLEAAIIEAKDDLASLKPSKTVANADAVALQGFATALGVKVDTDTLNRLLVVLAVLVIELGGGLAFAVGASVSVAKNVVQVAMLAPRLETPPAMPRATTAIAENWTLTADTPPGTLAALSSLERPAPAQTTGATACPTVSTSVQSLVVPKEPAGRLLQLLSERGGEVFGGQRSFARALGISHGHVANVLYELSTAGRIVVETGSRGTRVRLVAA